MTRRKQAAFAAIVFFGTAVASAVAEDQRSPSEQYRELLKAYHDAASGVRKAKTDRQRQVVVARLGEFPQRFLELADHHPSDPVALTALRQAVQAVISTDSQAQRTLDMNRGTFEVRSQNDAASRIVTILLRDHLHSDQLGPICDRMRWGARQEFEPFLSAALKENPHRNVQGLACLAWAQLLHNQLRMMDLAKDRPELLAHYRLIFGQNSFAETPERQRAALQMRMETLYEQAAEYDDVVNLPFRSSVAEKARTELYDIRHLTPGKRAPEIAGQDQDGRQFKLSDYRGRIVLLYFWSQY